jgi:hypothetical protein
MFLYYQTGIGTSEPELYVDFSTLKEKSNIPGITLFRKLREFKGITYRNRKLYRLDRDLINTIPEIIEKNPQTNEINK